MRIYLKEFAVFEEFDKKFVFRVRPYSSDEITNAEYEALAPLAGKNAAEVSQETFDILFERGIISLYRIDGEAVAKSDDELASRAIAEIKVSKIDLSIVQGCNMRCTYCYAGEGDFGRPKLMTWETAKAAADFIIKEAASVEGGVSLSFFGGEPTLAFPLIKKMVTYCEEKNANMCFSVVTNGSLLTDEMIDFFAEHNMSVQVSFDGPREYQNKHRILKDGGDSYDVVMKNIEKLRGRIEERKIGYKSVIYADEDIAKVDAEFARLGIKRHSTSYVRNSVYAASQMSDFVKSHIKEKEALESGAKWFVEAVKARDAKAVKDAVGKKEAGMRILYMLENDIKKQVQLAQFCGGAKEEIGITVDGDIYPCSCFSEVGKYKIGNVFDGKLELGIFAKHVASVNPKCRGCYARYSCGGTCLFDSMSSAPEGLSYPAVFYMPEEHCELTRAKLRVHAYIKASVDDDDRKWLRENALVETECR